MQVIKFERYSLPKIYTRHQRQYYLDPIRQRLIEITPEETVRQQVISYLTKKLHVPINAIKVEEHLSHYGMKSKQRADIVIHQFDSKRQVYTPLAVIECKARGVFLGEKELNQMYDYADLLACTYAMITDEHDVFSFQYDEQNNIYQEIESLPSYCDMMNGDGVLVDHGKIPDRIPFEGLPTRWKIYRGKDIGNQTDPSKGQAMVNLWECFRDPYHQFPARKFKMFSVIEDYGVRLLSYGDASGGIFSGPYRSFLMETNGDTRFVSFSVSTYSTYAHPDTVKTSLNIAIDNEVGSHHSLQLVIDEHMRMINNQCQFFHNGKTAIGNIGSEKISELRSLTEKRYPTILQQQGFFLGTLTYNRLWTLDDEMEVIPFLENLISYALIRDEYRLIRKRQKSKNNQRKKH